MTASRAMTVAFTVAVLATSLAVGWVCKIVADALGQLAS